MAIITDICAVSGHPYTKLTPINLAILLSANSKIQESYTKRGSRITRLIECFLQTADRTLELNSVVKNNISKVFQEMIGALLSGLLLTGTPERNEDYARHLGALHDQLCIDTGHEPDLILRKIMAKRHQELRNACIAKSANLSWNRDLVWVWHGWTVGSTQRKAHLKLYPIYEKFGKPLTDKIYNACTKYFNERTVCTIECLESFVLFLGRDECTFNEQDLLDRRKLYIFLAELANFHTQYNLGKEALGKKPVSPDVFISDWNNHFRTLIVDYLIPEKILAAPHDGYVSIADIPMIPGNSTKQARRLKARTKKIEGGVIAKFKTITPIPMHVTNDDALDVIIQQLRQDYQKTVEWAIASIKSIEARLDEVDHIYASGSCTSAPTTDVSNITLEVSLSERTQATRLYIEHGFQPSRDFFTNLRSPKECLGTGDLARWLCVPKADLLTPFTILLAANHEGITNSFLDKCFVPEYEVLPGGSISLFGNTLIGAKPRANLPVQHIELNEQTIWAVKVLIRLTEPVRKYLRNNRRDSILCYRLFLSTGKGFGQPKGVTTSSSTSSSKLRHHTQSSIAQLLGLDDCMAKYLADNISVNTVRSSSVVIKVIDSLDLNVATKSLKHAYFDLRLLEHYIPKLVLVWLIRREIISWNTIILVQALNGRPDTWKIANFDSQAQLEKFLANHIKLPYPKSPPSPLEPKTTEAIIGIDEDIVSIMASIELAVEIDPQRSTPFAIYWAAFYKALRTWIHTPENPDEYLIEILYDGESRRDVAKVIKAVYKG